MPTLHCMDIPGWRRWPWICLWTRPLASPPLQLYMTSSPHINLILFSGLHRTPVLMSILFSATILYPLIVKSSRAAGHRNCSILGSLKLAMSQALPPFSSVVLAGGAPVGGCGLSFPGLRLAWCDCHPLRHSLKQHPKF